MQQPVQSNRRRFLKRNIAAIGALAASTLTRGAASAAPFMDSSSNGGGWSRSDQPVNRPGHPNCFLKGAKIRTIFGERAIEDLAVGDVLPTVFGGMQTVQWIGRYAYQRSNPSKPWHESVAPIRIAASAIAPGVPRNDLFVTSGHLVYLDGVLIPARDLVNGATIAPYAADEFNELVYFHIKLEAHDVVHAECLGCETLLKVSDTASNFADYYRRFGEPNEQATLCAPLVQYDGRRGRIASRLRSAASPWLDLRTRLDVIRDGVEERAAL